MKITKILFSIIAIFLLPAMMVKAQGFKLEITIEGNEDSILTIGYHLGDKQYIKDTITTDSEGYGIYEGEEMLDQGLYIILLPDNRYFDIIIDDDQFFSISCSKDDIVGTMKIDGSEENTGFIQYQRKWIRMQEHSRNLKTRLEQNKSSQDSTAILQEMITDYEKTMVEFLKETADSKPGSFLSLLVRALIPMEQAEFNIAPDSHNPDSLRWIMRYNYNVKHFFDNVDLSDSRLIRTPVLYGRLKTYFSRILIQHPDTLIRHIPEIVSLTEADSTMFRYMVVFLFNQFRESQIMGHDGVVVKIIDDYYLSGKAYWISDETYKSLEEDAERISPNLIGKKAVNLVMNTYEGIPRSLYDVKNEYTILYFWEPNCGHCKTTTPKLKELYDNRSATDFEVFSVCTQGSKEEWEQYIAEHELNWINGWDPTRSTHYDFFYNVNATPLIYILDRDKNIIAKKISVEMIEDFISNYKKTNR